MTTLDNSVSCAKMVKKEVIAMKLFPEKDVTIETDRTPLEVLHILQNNTVVRLSIFNAANNKPFVGTIGFPDFRVRHCSGYRNSLDPEIKGTIRPGSVTVHMGIPTGVRVFLIVVPVSLALMFMLCGIFDKTVFLFGILFFLLLAVVLLIFRFIYLRSVKNTEADLRDILN